MKVVTILIAILALSGCKENSGFHESNCEIHKHGSLVVQFSNKNTKRTVTVNTKENVMTFKGTTYQDMKWSTEVDKVEKFAINKENIFMAKFKDGNEYLIGKVEKECEEIMRGYLGALLQTK